MTASERDHSIDSYVEALKKRAERKSIMLIIFLIAALVLFILSGLNVSREWFNPLGWGLAVLTAGYLLLNLGIIAAGR